MVRDSEPERVERVTRVRKVRGSETATTHYLLCPFMTFYALWYPRMKRAQSVTSVTSGRKVTRVTRSRKVRDSETVTTHYLLCPFMTFYALWYPRMKKAQRSQGSGYCPRGRYVSFCLAYKQLGLPTGGSPIVIGVGICYQMITRSSTGRYIASSSVMPKASYHDCMLRNVAFTRLRPRE